MSDKTIWEKIQTNPAMLEHLANKPKDTAKYNPQNIHNLCVWMIQYYELVCELDSVYNS